ncbi:hypothetical protein NKH52_26295 [Mesorhizobium sp. M1066]|uniref:hypothetical protein n=1 Tax=unclassified Mesorhizobium TaxID=325217 RepID=UPI0033364902
MGLLKSPAISVFVALFASFHVLFVGSTTHAGSIALLPLTTTSGLLLLTVFIVGVLVALLACLHMLFVTTTLIGHSSSPSNPRGDNRLDCIRRVRRERSFT